MRLVTPSKGPKAQRQCNLLSAQSQKGQNSYFPPTHSQKYLGWPSFQKCKSPMLISETGQKISKKKQDFCGKFPEQSISPQNRDCYHTSTFHLLHLHFICCAIIPRPAPFSDPSRLSAPELLFAFFPTMELQVHSSVGCTRMFQQLFPTRVFLCSCLKTTPTPPLTGQENFLSVEEQAR